MEKTVLFVGGGSVGHIAPAVAVAQALRDLKSDLLPHFVCGSKPEEIDYLKQEGFSPDSIDAPRLSVSFLWKFPRAYREAKKILENTQPSVVFSKGGYVSVPLCFAAHRKNIPIILHESDTISGRANKLVGRWAKKICLGFGDASSDSGKKIWTGNPVRNNVNGGDRNEGLRITGFTGEKPVLLVTGGSQGSVAINTAVMHHMDELLNVCDVIHLTGKGKKGVPVEKKGYWSAEFVVAELPHLYAISSIALSRAGFGNIAELAANGITAILVPLRGVGHDHQWHNAMNAAKTGGFLHLEQNELDKELVSAISELVRNSEKLKQMREKSKLLYNPHASRQTAQILLECLAEGK